MRQPPRQLNATRDQDNPDTQNVYIFLDGDHIRECTAYDADAGWIEQVALDEKGKPLICGDEFKFNRKHGRVKVAWIHPEKVHENPILYLKPSSILGGPKDGGT